MNYRIQLETSQVICPVNFREQHLALWVRFATECLSFPPKKVIVTALPYTTRVIKRLTQIRSCTFAPSSLNTKSLTSLISFFDINTPRILASSSLPPMAAYTSCRLPSSLVLAKIFSKIQLRTFRGNVNVRRSVVTQYPGFAVFTIRDVEGDIRALRARVNKTFSSLEAA